MDLKCYSRSERMPGDGCSRDCLSDDIQHCQFFASTVYSGYSGHVYSGHFSWYKIHLFYHIQDGYCGQSDIVARTGWLKVATISEVYCICIMD